MLTVDEKNTYYIGRLQVGVWKRHGPWQGVPYLRINPKRLAQNG